MHPSLLWKRGHSPFFVLLLREATPFRHLRAAMVREGARREQKERKEQGAPCAVGGCLAGVQQMPDAR